MELRLWIAGFRALHDRARKGELANEERRQYLALLQLRGSRPLGLWSGKSARQPLGQ